MDEDQVQMDSQAPDHREYLEFDPLNEIYFIERRTDDSASQDNLSSLSSTGSPSHISNAPMPAAGLFHATFTMKNVAEEEKPVLFVIKTTSPFNYRVRPSHGIIQPNETKEVQIVMLSESKKNDKFLINFGLALESFDPEADFTTQFRMIPDADLLKRRLKCVYPVSFGLLAAAGGSSGATPFTTSKSAASITSPVAPNLAESRRLSDFKVIEQGEEDNQSVPSPKSSIVTANTVSNDLHVLQKDLREARAQIETLKRQIKQLTTASGAGGAGAQLRDILAAQYGAPPVLVVLVAILAFLLGLLF